MHPGCTPEEHATWPCRCSGTCIIRDHLQASAEVQVDRGPMLDPSLLSVTLQHTPKTQCPQMHLQAEPRVTQSCRQVPLSMTQTQPRCARTDPQEGPKLSQNSCSVADNCPCGLSGRAHCGRAHLHAGGPHAEPKLAQRGAGLEARFPPALLHSSPVGPGGLGGLLQHLGCRRLLSFGQGLALCHLAQPPVS